DAVLVVSFGGPEGRDDVIPFLENVLRGRNVPRERMLEVAEHYNHFEGVSPLNAQVRELISVLQPELTRRGIDVPVYWGNRNWHPLLPDTMREIADAGHRRVLALVLSSCSSYSSCRQYRENIQAARESVGDGAPVVDKVRAFFNHPGFIDASSARVADALEKFSLADRQHVHVAYTAHSIPSSMASTCRYEAQLTETARLISEHLGVPPERSALVFQSRSGRPQDPWLEPDICDHLVSLHSRGVRHVVIAPIGFLSDHMEVLFDLDTEARQLSTELDLQMERAATVGTHPAFVAALGDLIAERMTGSPDRKTVGLLGPVADVCPADCCPAPARRPAPAAK
ncbi:MAG: ferrochelatase, partial [Planctomycetaceae bacterium]|nr:ferrochelatase [Planctomycetaceae bacterium]